MKVDISGVKRKLSEQNMLAGRRAMANQMLSDMAPYVPFKEGTLFGTASIGINGDSLIWDTPYAKRMFYGRKSWKWTTEKHPLAGPRWDLRTKNLFMSDWIKAFTEGSNL